MKEAIRWLLDSDPWVVYNTRVNLLDEKEDSYLVKESRSLMNQAPKILSLISELENWPGYALRNHKDSNHLIHKLSLLADFGFTRQDDRFDAILNKVLENKSGEGPFQVLINIPKRYGGTGTDDLGWIICDAPVLLYSLIKMGCKDSPGVIEAVEYLLDKFENNGWGCASTASLSKFRGPGRKTDPCPYANLLMLKLISLLPEYHNHKACKAGLDCFFSLWAKQGERKPYLFGIGSDFRKLKAPLVWYDILHSLEIFSTFPKLRNHKIVLQMAEIVSTKADGNGLFKPESVYKAWSDWDFGQKRVNSAWISFLVMRILKRLDGIKDHACI